MQSCRCTTARLQSLLLQKRRRGLLFQADEVDDRFHRFDRMPDRDTQAGLREHFDIVSTVSVARRTVVALANLLVHQPGERGIDATLLERHAKSCQAHLDPAKSAA